MNERVTGIGGVFLTTEDPKAMRAWYDRHLGLNFGDQGHNSFLWKEQDSGEQGRTEFSFFKKGTEYLHPSSSSFMINFRVKNLEALLETLRAEGVTIAGDLQKYPYGNFAWILDPDGNKIELWEPVEEGFDKGKG
jgi:catechol 2,3-dioxygenase-like lactoylglutathione lyase family enzyme